MKDSRRLFASNRAIAGFFVKMVGAYAVWFVLYDLWLLPDGRLDAWLSHAVAARTADLLSPFYTAVVEGRVVRIGAGSGILIADECNGLSALSLFVGFVLAYPGTTLRRVLFVPLGLLLIGLTNVARCAVLLVIQTEEPAWFEAAHHYQGLFLFYAVILALWVAWMHLGRAAVPDGGVPAARVVGTLPQAAV